MSEDNKVGFENGVPVVKVPVELGGKYKEFFAACAKLNSKILEEGTPEELEQVIVVAGRILGFSYAAFKSMFDCVNEREI